MEIVVKFDKDAHISAFAYNTGKIIERLIVEETNNLIETNKLLEGKILHFYTMIKDEDLKEEFANYFGIKPKRFGKIQEIENE
jgi:hypothetical protein